MSQINYILRHDKAQVPLPFEVVQKRNEVGQNQLKHLVRAEKIPTCPMLNYFKILNCHKFPSNNGRMPIFRILHDVNWTLKLFHFGSNLSDFEFFNISFFDARVSFLKTKTDRE